MVTTSTVKVTPLVDEFAEDVWYDDDAQPLRTGVPGVRVAADVPATGARVPVNPPAGVGRIPFERKGTHVEEPANVGGHPDTWWG